MSLSECDARLLRLKRYLPFLHQTKGYFSTSPEESFKITQLINIISNDGEQLLSKTLEKCEIFCRNLYFKYGKLVERNLRTGSNHSADVMKPNAQNRYHSCLQHSFQTSPKTTSLRSKDPVNSEPKAISNQLENPGFCTNLIPIKKKSVSPESYRLYPITGHTSRPSRTEFIVTPTVPRHSGVGSVKSFPNHNEERHTSSISHRSSKSLEGVRPEQPVQFHNDSQVRMTSPRSVEPDRVFDKNQYAEVDPSLQESSPSSSLSVVPHLRSPWNTARNFSSSASNSDQLPTPEDLHDFVFEQDIPFPPNSAQADALLDHHQFSDVKARFSQVHSPRVCDSWDRNSNSERNRQQNEPTVASECSSPNALTSAPHLQSTPSIQNDSSSYTSPPQNLNSSHVSLSPTRPKDSHLGSPNETQSLLQPSETSFSQPINVNQKKTEKGKETAKTLNNENEFVSPLVNLYSEALRSTHTGRGYGLQNYKIPKKVYSVNESTKDVGLFNKESDETTKVSENISIQTIQKSEESEAGDLSIPLEEIKEILKENLVSDDVDKVLDCLKTKIKFKAVIGEQNKTTSLSIIGEPNELSLNRTSSIVGATDIVTSSNVILETMNPSGPQEPKSTTSLEKKSETSRLKREIARLHENITDLAKGGSELGIRRCRSKSHQSIVTHIKLETTPTPAKRRRTLKASDMVKMENTTVNFENLNRNKVQEQTGGVIIKTIPEEQSTLNMPLSGDTANEKSVGQIFVQKGLSGRELYMCGNVDCDETAETIVDFKNHLFSCSVLRDSCLETCRHCGRKEETVSELVRHLRSHKGILCGLCPYRASRTDHVRNHMKTCHRIDDVMEVSVEPGLGPADAEHTL